MNGKVARKLKKAASKLCNPEKSIIFKSPKTGTEAWHPLSFMRIYRHLKKEYKNGSRNER